MTKLVIVESPTKAKTIRNFLPKDYKVVASMGHVRDLPQSAKDIPATHKDKAWSKIGVDVDNNFNPLYIVPTTKKKVIKDLKDLMKDATELYLATDEDREGESISWHLYEILKPKIPVKRMVFHEITKEAIMEALRNCRDIDDKLVRAQETRRILDRLVGYTVSPLLWKKIAYGLSAGRVQSVAVRLVVERERERRAFKQGTYWDLTARLQHTQKEFVAQLYSVDQKRIATGKDFDENTGQIAQGANVMLLSEQHAKDLLSALKDKPWQVIGVEEKPSTRKPYPPFITSTLQQEANRKLGMTARVAMRVAQNLYENGLITYMRTDSVNLSEQALKASRDCVRDLFGDSYLPSAPRVYTSKSKNAQEAHEAIRPAGSTFKHPRETGLSGQELALYELIWKRTVASQMADAQLTFINVETQVEKAVFKSTGKRIDFAGFLRAYVEGSDDPDSALEDNEILLPPLKKGDAPNCVDLKAQGHATQPPARYTEASLVKKLEAEGIGRPSTYASIISTIQDRGYVVMKGQALVPTFTAFAVTALLESHLQHLVDLKFTAKMEDTLDEISAGQVDWLKYLKEFYSAKSGLKQSVADHEGGIDPEVARTIVLNNLQAVVKIGRFGAYLEMRQGEEVLKANVPETVAPADLTDEDVARFIKNKQEGPQSLGRHPETDEPVYILDGRYGPYVQLGDSADDKKVKRVSLPKGMTPAQVTLDVAVGLLSLPRTLGEHPEGGKITTNVGRFGPFVCLDRGKEKEYRSLKVAQGDDVLTLTLERALELLQEPKGAGRGRKKSEPLKTIGTPTGGEVIELYKGPYGFYVKQAKVLASVPKDLDPQSVTLEQAQMWIADKASQPKAKKRSRRAG